MEKSFSPNDDSKHVSSFNNTNNSSNSSQINADDSKKRVFRSFTQSRSIEEHVILHIQSFTVVDNTGNVLNNGEALNVLASYQETKAQQNADALINRVRNFLKDPNFELNVRYIQSDLSPKEFVLDWLKRTLSYAIFPVPERFSYNKVSYSVVPIVKEIRYDSSCIPDLNDSGVLATHVIPGKVNVYQPSPISKNKILVSKDLYQTMCNHVISELQLKIEPDGTISSLGIPIMRWVVSPTILTQALSNDISDVQLNL